MENVVEVAIMLGYMTIPEKTLISIDDIKRYRDDQLVIVTTGSQGEAMSALFRMAYSDHRKVELTPNDLIIISASPIPGNEKTISRVITSYSATEPRLFMNRSQRCTFRPRLPGRAQNDARRSQNRSSLCRCTANTVICTVICSLGADGY